MNRQNRNAAVLAALAICLMLAGIRRGEMKTVLTKATAICMECIGIG